MATGYNVYGVANVNGVEIKIKECLNAPPKVTLPAKFQMGNPTEVLFMEYDFSLEEKVIAWCDKQKQVVAEREKALEEARLAAEEAARQKAEEEERKKAEEAKIQEEETKEREAAEQKIRESASENDVQASVSIDKEPEDLSKVSSASEFVVPESNVPQVEEHPTVGELSPNHLDQNMPNQRVEVPQLTPAMQVTAISQNSLRKPVFYNTVGGILTPLPAKPSAERHISVTSDSSVFDPKDFENNEIDPFESVELKTINDMEELNKVLQGVQVSQNVETNNPFARMLHENKQTISYTSSQEANSYRGQVSNVGFDASKQTNMFNCVNGATTNPFVYKGTGLDQNYGQSSKLPTHFSPQQGNSGKTSVANSTDNRSAMLWHTSNYTMNPGTNNGFTNYMAATGVAPQYSNLLIQSVNPVNVVTAEQKELSGFNATHASFSSSNPFATNFSSTVSSQPAATNNPWLPYQSNSGVLHNRQVWQESYQKTSPNSYRGSYFQEAPVQLNVSEFDKLKNESSGSRSHSHSRSGTPTPNRQEMKGSKSTPDLTALASSSGFDNGSFCPPLVGQSITSTSQQKPPAHDSVAPPVSHKTHIKSTEPDPYKEMDGPTRLWVDRLTNMGFLRSRVAKAVKTIGGNHKKVLEYLCSTNRLAEKGFAIEEAEDVLRLQNYDEKRAEKFLRLSKTFQEFGFSNDKIRESLLKNDLDGDSSLDWLTSVS